MGDSYIQQPGSEGFSRITDYTTFFDDLRSDLTGRRMVTVPAGVVVLPDGSKQDQWITKLSDPDPNAPLNDKGAAFVCEQVRLLLNKHGAMGNLNNDGRIRKLVVSTCNAIGSELISNCSDYIPGDNPEERFGSLQFHMVGVRNGVYEALTAIKNGEILVFGQSTTGAQTVVKQENKPEAIIH